MLWFPKTCGNLSGALNVIMDQRKRTLKIDKIMEIKKLYVALQMHKFHIETEMVSHCNYLVPSILSFE